MAHTLTVCYWREYDPEPKSDLLPVVVQAEDDDILRQVLRDALQNMLGVPYRDNTFLLEFGRREDAEEVGEPVETEVDSNRPYLGVDANGRLFADDWDLQTMTVGDLRRAFEHGYMRHAWDHITVIEPDGLGGPGEVVVQLTEFLRAVGVEFTVGLVTVPLLWVPRRLRRAVTDRRARKVAADWLHRGLDPWALTAWVDVKTAWPVDEVAERLGLSRAEAQSLLEAMGYEFSERLQAWTVGTSGEAVEKRRRWDTTEWTKLWDPEAEGLVWNEDEAKYM